MSAEPQPELSPLKRALIAIDQLQARLDAVERAGTEPIAVIGMACRFPGGADDPESYWQLLVEGREAIREVPADRWDIDALYDPDPDTPGKMSTRRAAFLDDVTGFDPQLFGIAPREAASMDPQQRLLLEVAWEALEQAGIAPDRLNGSRTGVFVGMTTSDYSTVQVEAAGLEGLDAYYTTGIAHSIASGRLSYVLGLRGPSITIDTACSSSLVAVHLAVQSLRAGESRLALAGGVNLILSPENSIMLSKFHMMAPDGRCKAFDAAADGFVRGEGCGIVALKRLSDASADGDPILAVIRGSAVNQDGASGGLTAPNGPSQEAVVADALADAGLSPADIDYVEAHGTGTALGDPIEVQALAAALGAGRTPATPLAIGSVKTNIGHLEATAGVAGLMKAVLVAQRGEVPPHLHLTQPSPHIDWDSMPIVVPTELTPIAPGRRAVVGVSAFGFSGTNAHVVVEAAPANVPVRDDPRPAHVLTLSARTAGARRAAAVRLAAHLTAHPELVLGDVCATVNAGRARLAHRLAVVATDCGELARQLSAFADGESPPAVATAEFNATDPPRVAMLFTGQGAQTLGMGGALREREPVFRSAFDELVAKLDREFAAADIAPLLSDVLGASPGSPEAALLDQTLYTQTSLFALELALVELWRSWGVTASGVIGHSLGEIVAAVVAGVVSVDDGVRMVTARGRLMQALPTGGAMLAVFAAADDVERAVDAATRSGGTIAVAAINAPRHVVVSGAVADVDRLHDQFVADGVRVQRLVVSHAFHSPLMQPMVDEFRSIVAGIEFRPPRIRVISNVTGEPAAEQLTDPEYWVGHVLAPVRFADGIAALATMGFDVLLEVGPHPVLSAMAQDTLGAVPNRGSHTFAASLRRQHDDHHQLAVALGALELAGVAIDWRSVDSPHGSRRVSLPTYPFERSRFWVTPRRRPPVTNQSLTDHPLLGTRLRSPLSTITFESTLSIATVPVLGDHRVFETAILPATAFVEIAVAAAAKLQPGVRVGIDDIVIHEALVAADDDLVTVQTIVTPDAGGMAFRIYARTDDAGAADAGRDAGDWTLHASGRVSGTPAEHLARSAQLLATVRDTATSQVDGGEHDARLRDRGLVFGPSLRNVRRVWVSGRAAVGELELAPPQAAEATRYVVHPALLDAAIQILADLTATEPDTYLPLSVDRVVFDTGGVITRGWSHVVLAGDDDPIGRPETLTADVALLDADGAVVASIQGLRLKRADAAALRRLGGRRAATNWVHEVVWRPVAHATAPTIDVGEVAATADAAAGRLHDQHDLGHYEHLLTALEQLSTAYIVQALGELGVELAPGAWFEAGTLRVAERHRRLFDHLLDFLVTDGIVRRSSVGWEVVDVPEFDTGDTRLAALMDRFPGGVGELSITRRCGEQLAAALIGDADPLQLLFPGGSLENAEQLYQVSPFAHFYNSLAAEAVASAVTGFGPQRRLRVLEIGAGTGGTTAFVLPRLPADRVEYVYTDISPHFLARARGKFADYQFIEYRTLDVEADLDAQGFGTEQFDVVVAANVLHATADLRRTFDAVGRLLVPGGVLVMVEMVRPERFISISFGLTDGWWKFNDTDLRPDSLLLTTDRWRAFLDGNGFADTHAVPQWSPNAIGPTGATSVQAVVIARRDAHVTGVASNQHWLVVAGAGDVALADQLAVAIDVDGGRSVLVLPGEAFVALDDGRYQLDATDPAQVQMLLAAIGSPTHVAQLLVDPPADRGDTDRGRIALHTALTLTQALVNRGDASRMIWLTNRAQPADGPVLDADGALLWGFARTVALEHPELHPLCIDIDDGVDAHAVLLAVAGVADEDQLALRGTQRYVARIVPMSLGATAVPTRDDDSVELVITGRGSLDQVELVAADRRPPGPGEVEIHVIATALNFKDVLNVLGMYPGDPGPLGGECAGIVVAVGDGVDSLVVGDRVAALAPGAFRSYVTCDARFVATLPDALATLDAAGLLIANVTAEYALAHLGQLAAGERVLIHAAAGGVGLAAVALAQRAGAEVFVTAGSEAKRQHLRQLGVEHVYDSRSLDFVQQIAGDTAGEGIDVVLNSLAGEFVTASLGLVRAGGRFLEIGKRDHLTPEQAAALDGGIEYHVIDWTDSLRTEPELIRAMVLAAVDRVERGDAAPLPVHSFMLGDVRSAMRFMAQARHIGKVVVVHPGAEGAGIVADATYLVTGGLGGLGLLTAQHLAQRGARHLVLLGRRSPSEAAHDVIAQLAADGVEVVTVAGDVADETDVATALDTIAHTMPPLRGVFHSAGTLDPAAIAQMTWDQMQHVLRPKVDGAAVLDRLTAGIALDHFVIFASIASVLGARGQSNHSAANAYLDALASRRAGTGSVATSIDWGAWSEIGSAAELGVDKRIGEHGLGVIAPDDGIEILDRLLERPPVHVVVSPVDWAVLLERRGSAGTPPFFAEVAMSQRRHVVTADVATPVTDLADRLAAMPTERRLVVLSDHVRERAAHVLAVSPADIGDQVPLSELGLDSLMAVELRNLIGGALGPDRPIPATLVFDYPTVTAIAGFLATELSSDVGVQAVEPAAPAVDGALVTALLDDLEHLSDDEIDAELARRGAT